MLSYELGTRRRPLKGVLKCNGQKKLGKTTRPGKKPLSLQVPFAILKNAEPKSSKLVSETLLECIRIGDVDSFREALASHIVNSNKLRLAKKTGLGRRAEFKLRAIISVITSYSSSASSSARTSAIKD